MRPRHHLHLLPHVTLAALAIASYSLGTAESADADEPAALVGTWTWTWKDGEGKTHKHVLDIEAAGGKLTARERFDDLPSVKVDDMALKGKELSFSVKRANRMAEYKGKLVGEATINGVVNVAVDGQANEFQWTAERALPTKKG